MGHWNGYENYGDWFIATQQPKKCCHCQSEYYPKSPTSKYCAYDDSPECVNDRYYQKLWDKGKHPLQLELNNNA